MWRETTLNIVKRLIGSGKALLIIYVEEFTFVSSDLLVKAKLYIQYTVKCQFKQIVYFWRLYNKYYNCSMIFLKGVFNLIVHGQEFFKVSMM